MSSPTGRKAAPSSNTSSSTMQLSGLPPAITERILLHVPQQQRLSRCALVSKSWHAAAAHATVAVDACLTDSTSAAFEDWLEQHAGQIKSLKLQAGIDPRLRLRLPWAGLVQLQSISLADVELVVILSSGQATAAEAAGSGSAGDNNSNSTGSDQQDDTSPAPSTHGTSSSRPQLPSPPTLLPRLQQLELSSCTLDNPNSLVALASSSELTSLVVDGDCEFAANNSEPQVSAAVATLLQRLQQQIVVLRLPGKALDQALDQAQQSTFQPTKHFSAMPHLQELHVDVAQFSKECQCFSHLPGILTKLELQNPAKVELEPIKPPQLQQLSNLRHLSLRQCSLLPEVLGSMTMLQHLHLHLCRLPLVEYDMSESTAALLSALQQLTRLQRLHMHAMQLDVDGTPPEQWSALTASTQLTCLWLSEEEECVWDNDRPQQPLPQGAAKFLFPAGRQLPHLQTLALVGPTAWYSPPIGFDDDREQQHDWCLDSDDLRRIVSCCPGLRELNVHCTVYYEEDEVINDAVEEGASTDISALLQLPTCLRSLTVGGDGFTDKSAPVIAQLTQVTHIAWKDSPKLTYVGLQQLANLTRLCRLDISGCGCGGHLKLEWSDTKGPVYKQIDAICDGSEECAMLRPFKNEVKQLRAEVEDARQQLADSQAKDKAEIDALRHQLADSQAENGVLHRQLADSQALVARLQQQLAAASLSGGDGGGQQVAQR